MKKHDLLRNAEIIIRVLDLRNDNVLIIDCIKKTMPIWAALSDLDSFSGYTDKELKEVTGVTITNIDTLDSDQSLPFASDDKMCSRLISSMAAEHEVSKQTISNPAGAHYISS